jgi:hypothetical protein
VHTRPATQRQASSEALPVFEVLVKLGHPVQPVAPGLEENEAKGHAEHAVCCD